MYQLLILILIFMIFAGLLAIETKDLVSAVVLMGAVGFGLSVCFILLRAPEVALAQIVLEVVVLILLLRGTIGLGVKTVSGTRGPRVLYLGIALVFLILGTSIFWSGEIPYFGEASFVRFKNSASWFYLEGSLSLTGAGNTVNAILMDFRALDTLGAMLVLFAVLLGTLLLTRRSAYKVEETKEDSGKNSSRPGG